MNSASVGHTDGQWHAVFYACAKKRLNPPVAIERCATSTGATEFKIGQ